MKVEVIVPSLTGYDKQFNRLLSSLWWTAKHQANNIKVNHICQAVSFAGNVNDGIKNLQSDPDVILVCNNDCIVLPGWYEYLKNNLTDFNVLGLGGTLRSGHCWAAKKSVWDNVGLLDENLFNSHEDDDWFLRAEKKGYVVTPTPKSYVVHEGSHTLKQFDNSTTFKINQEYMRGKWPKESF